MTQDMAKMADKELFGSPAQMAMMERGRALWALVCNDPNYSFYGRTVSLSVPSDDAFDQIAALARLQGGTNCHFFPKEQADGMCRELEEVGLRTSRHEQYRGSEGAYDAAKQFLASTTLPDDLSVGVVDMATPGEIVKDIAEVSLACGVMPVPGDAMRGHVRDGLCLAALDANGNVAGTASAYMNNHPEGERATEAFWGMLASREDRCGENIDIYLGALAILQMWENHGARAFNTGVAASNEALNAACSRLVMSQSEWLFLGCTDPDAFDGENLTR